MNDKKSNIKICLISSHGGHLKQLRRCEKVYKKYDHFLISPKPDKRGKKIDGFNRTYFIINVNEGRGIRNPLRFFVSLYQTLRILLYEKPDFVLSTGAGVAVPGFLIAKILRIPSIFIEVGARVVSLSKTGKVCYYLANLFLVQHPRLVKKFPHAIYSGSLYKHLSE